MENSAHIILVIILLGCGIGVIVTKIVKEISKIRRHKRGNFEKEYNHEFNIYEKEIHTKYINNEITLAEVNSLLNAKSEELLNKYYEYYKYCK